MLVSKQGLVLFWLHCLTSLALAWPALPLGPIPMEAKAVDRTGNDTIIYVEDLHTGLVFAQQADRIEERHPPYSSFKIPNFLIALETGVADSPKMAIAYSPARRPEQAYWPDNWAQDQTLESAFRRSAAWAFQDLALRIGEETYAGYLKHFSYGNRQAPGDAFWLGSPLTISVKEQVDFLRRLLTAQLEIAPLHLEALRQVARQKSNQGFTLFGKTGSGPVQDGDFGGEFQGWFVGWLERPNKAPVLVALWTRGSSYRAIKDYRRDTCVEVLEQLDYLPLGW